MSDCDGSGVMHYTTQEESPCDVPCNDGKGCRKCQPCPRCCGEGRSRHHNAWHGCPDCGGSGRKMAARSVDGSGQAKGGGSSDMASNDARTETVGRSATDARQVAPPLVCQECGHEHAGVELAFICVGCPCQAGGVQAGGATGASTRKSEGKGGSLNTPVALPDDPCPPCCNGSGFQRPNGEPWEQAYAEDEEPRVCPVCFASPDYEWRVRYANGNTSGTLPEEMARTLPRPPTSRLQHRVKTTWKDVDDDTEA